METKRELKILAWIILVFAAVFFLPLGSERFMTAIDATLDLARWYAREHVILCLLPAFFIAGVIAVFVSQGSVIKYFGANAKKWLSYSVAAISGGILAVCSCTILPLFTSIYKRGAGLGPAIAFLYSGPAISILSIILTARILGIELGIARTLGAILFSVVIGLLMSFLFRREERAKREEQMNITPSPEKRPMWQTSFHFFTLVLILVFANWGAPAASDRGLWAAIFAWKWYITGALSLVLCWSLVKILRLRLRWVALGAAATVVSVVLAYLFIRDAKLEGEWSGVTTPMSQEPDMTPVAPFRSHFTLTAADGTTTHVDKDLISVEMRMQKNYRLRGGDPAYGGATFNAYFFYFRPAGGETTSITDTYTIPQLMLSASAVPTDGELDLASGDEELHWNFKYKTEKDKLYLPEYFENYQMFGSWTYRCPDDVKVTVVKNDDKTWKITFRMVDYGRFSNYSSTKEGSQSTVLIEWEGPMTKYSGSETNDLTDADY